MSQLVLTQERFVLLRDAIESTLELFHSVVITEKESLRNNSLSLTIGRLEEIDKEKWRNIRLTYLSDPYFGYVTGNFTNEELTDPRKLMLDLVKRCDQIQETLITKTHDLYSNQKEHREQVRKLEAQVKSLEVSFKDSEIRRESAREDLAASRAEVLSLHKELAEKREAITRLSRDSTVQIWQKERERVLAESDKTINQLESDKKRLEQDNDRMRRIMDKKLQAIGEQNKMLKMKQELNGSNVDKSGADNKLKNENYLLQKDLAVLEKELQRVQLVFAGILNGLKNDMKITTKKHQSQTYGELLSMDMKHLMERITFIYDQSLSGKLWTESEKLPPSYKELHQDVTTTKTKKLSAFGRANRLSPIENGVHKPKVEDVGKRQSSDKISTNPQIVDPETGRINSTLSMKHYPCISQSSIKEYWEQFNKFDTDGNSSLDFPEVLRALQTTVGFQFSPTQVEACFNEVDVNRSNTIDFFEYLKITQLLVDRNGQSDIFKSGVAKTKSMVISKTCAIQ